MPYLVGLDRGLVDEDEPGCVRAVLSPLPPGSQRATQADYDHRSLVIRDGFGQQ
jgi:hypothetical protein